MKVYPFAFAEPLVAWAERRRSGKAMVAAAFAFQLILLLWAYTMHALGFRW